MAELKVGDQAPDFTLPTDGNGAIKLSDLTGKNCIVYFYPKDDTPGCTIEAKDFTEFYQAFQDKNAEIIGISKDSVAKHDKFKSKYDLAFTLGSDEEGNVCENYGVWVEKNMYGRKYMGIERATFLVGEDGKIKQIWRKVKAKGHAEEVLGAV